MTAPASGTRFWINDRPFEFAGVGALGAAAVWWIVDGNVSSLVVAAGALAICLVAVQSASRKLSLWVTSALVSHVVLGMALDGYSIHYFDDAMHFALVGWLTVLAVNEIDSRIKWNGAKLSRQYLVVVGMMFALGIGALWEFFEFGVDLTGAYQAQLGLTDTMTDLLADGAGGGSAALLMTLGREKGTG